MTDDLVERLHKWVDDLEHDRDYDLEFELSGGEAGKFANDICGMLTRIEKLEAALREITWIATPDHEEARHKATEIARKALEKEDD